jgi:glycosyltransferase involved in cell wall biosynthesis
MPKSKVQIAASEYSKGNYSLALKLYKELSDNLGQNLFSVNVWLCEKQLMKNSIGVKFFALDAELNINEKIRSLIFFAKSLSQQKLEPVLTDKRKIALIVNQKELTKELILPLKEHLIAQGLTRKDWDVICMLDGQQLLGNFSSEKLDVIFDGIHFLSQAWPTVEISSDFETQLSICVENYINWFMSCKPLVVIIKTNSYFALPALIAAKKLSLPVIKEYVYFADDFNELNDKSIYKCLNFKQKYLAEQACLDLTDQSYYTNQSVSNEIDLLDRIIQKLCFKNINKDQLKILHEKEILIVEKIINNEGLYFVEFNLEDLDGGSAKGLVINIKIYNFEDQLILFKIPGFGSSEKFTNYKYVNTLSTNGSSHVLVFDLPSNTSRIEVDFCAFQTNKQLIIRSAEIDKVNLTHISRWLSLKPFGIDWIIAVEDFIKTEGAISLYIGILTYKSQLTNNSKDYHKLNMAIEEIIELYPSWIPEFYINDKQLKIKSTEKFTVVHLNKTAYPYENTGGSIRCLNTVLSQKHIGIDPYIITSIGYPCSVGVMGAAPYEIIEGVEHFRIGSNSRGLRGISLPDRIRYSLFHTAKILQQRGGHVIHAASGLRGYELALLGISLKKITGLPLIYEVRSFHEHTWTPIRDGLIDLEKTQLRIIKENFCMAEADFVTTISESMKNILIQRGVHPEKIEIIPNAIDASKYLGKTFLPADIPALHRADLVVGYVSNMSGREGHKYLIHAIHQIRKLTSLDVRGLLVGDGPEKKNLEILSKNLTMEKFIVFTGEVDHNNINAFYKAINIFVVPRIPDYAADWVTPLKPYEAMALDIPIIVTDLPALKEIVGNNEERGLIAKTADVDSLVEQLLRYINDPIMRKRKSNVAKAWVFAERTWSANAKRYDAIYRRLANRSIVNSNKHDKHN